MRGARTRLGRTVRTAHRGSSSGVTSATALALTPTLGEPTLTRTLSLTCTRTLTLVQWGDGALESQELQGDRPPSAGL